MKNIKNKVFFVYGIIAAITMTIWSVATFFTGGYHMDAKVLLLPLLFGWLPFVGHLLLGNNIINDCKRFFYLFSHYGLFTLFGFFIILSISDIVSLDMINTPSTFRTAFIVTFIVICVTYCLAAFWPRK